MIRRKEKKTDSIMPYKKYVNVITTTVRFFNPIVFDYI